MNWSTHFIIFLSALIGLICLWWLVKGLKWGASKWFGSSHLSASDCLLYLPVCSLGWKSQNIQTLNVLLRVWSSDQEVGQLSLFRHIFFFRMLGCVDLSLLPSHNDIRIVWGKNKNFVFNLHQYLSRTYRECLNMFAAKHLNAHWPSNHRYFHWMYVNKK
jgi:hypothetical protein